MRRLQGEGLWRRGQDDTMLIGAVGGASRMALTEHWTNGCDAKRQAMGGVS